MFSNHVDPEAGRAHLRKQPQTFSRQTVEDLRFESQSIAGVPASQPRSGVFAPLQEARGQNATAGFRRGLCALRIKNCQQVRQRLPMNDKPIGWSAITVPEQKDRSMTCVSLESTAEIERACCEGESQQTADNSPANPFPTLRPLAK